MRKLTCYILIDVYEFESIVDFEIESSWEKLTKTLELTFPKKIEWKGKNIWDFIRRGMPVTVAAGYDGNLTELFSGYVRDLNAKVPIRISCEDDMYLFKQNTVSFDFPGGSALGNILSKIVPAVAGSKYSYQASNIHVGKMRVNRETPAQILDSLRGSQGIYSFTRNGKLYSGYPYDWPGSGRHSFTFGEDIIEQESDLRYMIAEDVKVSVRAISIQADGSSHSQEAGDNDSETFSYYFYGKPESALLKLAQAELSKLKYDGYRGYFTTFGDPAVNPGDTVEIVDPAKNYRTGNYLVSSVRTTFGLSGYRQQIEIDKKTA